MNDKNTQRFMVTGWSTRYQCWMPELLEARSEACAIEKFTALKPSLTAIKIEKSRRDVMDKIFNEFWEVCDNLPDDYDWAVDPLGILE